MQTLSKEDIKAWLKNAGKDRQWLADETGVSRFTVNNWLSSNIDIPESKLRLIASLRERLAAENVQKAKLNQPSNQIFSVEIDLPTFRAYSKAALAAGLTVEEWAIQELNEAAEVAEKAGTYPKPVPFHPGSGLRAAEDPAGYG